MEWNPLAHICLDCRIKKILGKAAQKHGHHKAVVERHGTCQEHPGSQQEQPGEHHLSVAVFIPYVGGKKPQHGSCLVQCNHRCHGC